MSSESGHTEKLGFDECTVPETNVSVYEALYRRRMAWNFKDQPVPKEALARMLETRLGAEPSPHRTLAVLHPGAGQRGAGAGGRAGP